MVTREFSDDVPQGSVISTRPGGRHEACARARRVALVVSKGARIDVPDVTGESDEADARSELRRPA